MCPPCHVFAYIWANTRTSALQKLDFSQLWVWKRAVHFLPHKVISFRWKKNKVRRKYQNFIRGDPYELGQTPLWRTKVSKVKPSLKQMQEIRPRYLSLGANIEDDRSKFKCVTFYPYRCFDPPCRAGANNKYHRITHHNNITSQR